ncbi:MAG: hydantoinase B/oxoprolinase family protein [Candidatus Korarchaeota archaeon]|nr:hydantoinase B/oxoprolinase family protein [Candidatus Korarchaeota archaeon]
MVDPVTVEVIRSSSSYIAEEMGIVLRNAAYSPNIRDRMDHSCAILLDNGEMIAQAEHIPVHLGSMAVGVKNTIDYLQRSSVELEEGDIIVLNDPYIAGTHLNDVTMVKPLFHRGEIFGYVANKAHHVDVGGMVPGSISGSAKELIQEGLVLPPLKIVRKGQLDISVLNLILSNVRVPRYTRGDLKAQIAALNVGERRLRELIDKYGLETVTEAWNRTIDYTANYLRGKLKEVPPGLYSAEDYMEADDRLLAIRVRVQLSKESIRVDFTETDEQVDIPINAVYGVTVAATSYAIKAALDPNLPMNYGFFKVVRVEAREGTLVHPKKPAPVAAGNVETSQRIAETVLKALAEPLRGRIPAASHGSMNNVMVGGIHEGRSWAFYETIGGGMGGRPGKDGVDGVHTHMTNTMNTPIEVIERECPVLFVEYSLRDDSGGPGQYRGGLGITRAFKILSDRAVLSIATERVKLRPWGLEGGLEGKNGFHYVKRNGERIVLGAKATMELMKGDVVYINTPGGGGYGDPKFRDPSLVKEDLLDGKISEETALKVYGLTI